MSLWYKSVWLSTCSLWLVDVYYILYYAIVHTWHRFKIRSGKTHD